MKTFHITIDANTTDAMAMIAYLRTQSYAKIKEYDPRLTEAQNRELLERIELVESGKGEFISYEEVKKQLG